MGLGLGDVKLAAVAGAWTGLAGLANVWLFACIAAIGFVLFQRLAGANTISRETRIAFGAFLAPAIWAVWALQQGGFL